MSLLAFEKKKEEQTINNVYNKAKRWPVSRYVRLYDPTFVMKYIPYTMENNPVRNQQAISGIADQDKKI